MVKLDKISEATVFRHWEIYSRGLQSLRERKYSKWALYLSQVSAWLSKECLEVNPKKRTTVLLGRGNRSAFWVPETAGILRKGHKKEVVPEIHRGLLLSLWLNTKLHMCRLRLHKAGREKWRVVSWYADSEGLHSTGDTRALASWRAKTSLNTLGIQLRHQKVTMS